VRAAALALLAERPMHGYEMIQELSERTGGVWRPSPGSIYPALALLEDEGLVTADAGSGKRLFQLTDAGREAAAAAGERTPWDDVTAGISDEDLSLRKLAGQVLMAVKQVAEAADADAKAKAVTVLTDARKQLYGILAEAD
jgi:DNA-binding PadR family transcriptional regulator